MYLWCIYDIFIMYLWCIYDVFMMYLWCIYDVFMMLNDVKWVMMSQGCTRMLIWTHLNSFVPPPLLKAVAGECQWASGQKLCPNSGMANDWWHQPYGSQPGTDRSARLSAPAARLHQAPDLKVEGLHRNTVLFWIWPRQLMRFIPPPMTPTTGSKASWGAGLHQGGPESVGGQ